MITSVNFLASFDHFKFQINFFSNRIFGARNLVLFRVSLHLISVPSRIFVLFHKGHTNFVRVAMLSKKGAFSERYRMIKLLHLLHATARFTLISVAEIAKLLKIFAFNSLKLLLLTISNTEIWRRFYELRNLWSPINVLLIDLFDTQSICENLDLKKLISKRILLGELKFDDPQKGKTSLFGKINKLLHFLLCQVFFSD